MPLENELNLSESELNRASPTLQNRILEKYARIKGLQLLQTGQMFQRDHRRLDAKTRATYKQLGVDVADDPPDENVLGNKTVLNNQWLPWVVVGTLGTMGILGMMQQRKPDAPQQIEAKDSRNEVTVSGGGR